MANVLLQLNLDKIGTGFKLIPKARRENENVR